jgi:hypothetical protein
MSPHFIIPKPRDWNTFEEIVNDVFSRKYENYNFQRYGRAGQAQDGVDIAGTLPSGDIIGVQCKHHPARDIPTNEIDREVSKSEGFSPSLSQYIIATSANSDVKAHEHVLILSQERVKQGKYPVRLIFWEGICSWLSEYPDLVYKHFTRYFPTHELERLALPGVSNQTKATLAWPVTTADLLASTQKSFRTVRKVGSYNVTLGLTTFPDVTFDGRVDLAVLLAEVYSSDGESQEHFAQTVEILRAAKAVVGPPHFSKDITVFIQARLSVAFLFGWLFRRVANYNLLLVHRDDLWTTTNLPHVPPALADGFPHLLNAESSEVAVVLSITRDISASVIATVEKWSRPPKAVLNYRLEGHVVRNAAHALSLSLEIAHKLKNLIDRWHVTYIHLFGALPAALAVMIGHNLNSICPISLYYLGEDRQMYHVGGTLHNGL